ncbi:MAG TPA: hypothetical protein VNN20_08825 [Thermodesulfobacteriota bacterium]|nr:hypothetical protein [Thermodesulfobacteriota bacterium]
MNGLIKSLSFSLALALTVSAGLISCGGGDGDGGQNGGETTTINGRVADVMTANAPSEKKTSMLALIKDFLSLSKKANAQASAVSGITVELIVDGETVDTDITDEEGNFTLSLTSSATTNITLVFITDEFSASTEITSPPGSIINIVVTLNPDEVIVDEMEVEGTIRCETGFVDISELGADIVVDGGGVDDCIRVEGNCVLNVESGSLILTNCQRCIDAGGTAELTIISGYISCDSTEDGIRARGTSATVSLATTDDISVTSGANGIRAEGNSTLSLDAEGNINISGEENGIRAEGNSTTTLSAGENIDISGNENGIRAEGTSTVDVSALGECTIFGSDSPIREDGVPTVDVGNCLLIGP